MEVTPLLLPSMVVVGARELIGKQQIADLARLVEMPWLQELGTNEVAGAANLLQIDIIGLDQHIRLK
jgi:hypothetical protein